VSTPCYQTVRTNFPSDTSLKMWNNTTRIYEFVEVSQLSADELLDELESEAFASDRTVGIIDGEENRRATKVLRAEIKRRIESGVGDNANKHEGRSCAK
jgi:hypothetical protein